jgi:hypothetical protein
MKLRYRMTNYSWYVPQYLLEDNTWQDFVVWNLNE